MNRPALAYVVNSLNPGGTEKLVVDMSLAFESDFDVVVICLDEPGLWATNLREKNIPVYCVWHQPGLDINMPVRLAQHFRRHRTNIIHAHQCSAWFYAALSRLLYSAPLLLLEEHGRFYPEVENQKRVLANRLIIRRLTHRFVAVSEDVKERLKKFEGLDKANIDVVYNGVNDGHNLSQEERAKRRAELGFRLQDFVVGTVGRFDAIKNLPMLVQSVNQASKFLPSLRALLVGDGPAFGETEGLIGQLGLTEKVVLTGHREDARDLIPCFDLFVLSSFSEGTSMALLEAMASGVPVAVTNVGGNPEIVLDGRTGWVVPSDCADIMANTIIEAAGNPTKRCDFGLAGKRRFEKHFTFANMIENYRKIYGKILAGHGRRSKKGNPLIGLWRDRCNGRILK
jgi:glycosyltransferase involved in cell wall biosynthesis